jgi:hypothetical protein
LTAPAARPLWEWVLLAIAPGLVSALLGACGEIGMLLSLAMPLIGTVYLIKLGRRYVKEVDTEYFSVLTFVLLYGAIDCFLWGAGCTFSLSRMHF